MLPAPQKRGIHVIHQPHLSCFRDISVPQWKPCPLWRCASESSRIGTEGIRKAVCMSMHERGAGAIKTSKDICLAPIVTVNALPAETQSEMLLPRKRDEKASKQLKKSEEAPRDNYAEFHGNLNYFALLLLSAYFLWSKSLKLSRLILKYFLCIPR